MYRGHGDDVTGDLCHDLPGSSPASCLAGSFSRCRSLVAATPAYISATHISVYPMLPYPNISLVYRATTPEFLINMSTQISMSSGKKSKKSISMLVPNKHV